MKVTGKRKQQKMFFKNFCETNYRQLTFVSDSQSEVKFIKIEEIPLN